MEYPKLSDRSNAGTGQSVSISIILHAYQQKDSVEAALDTILDQRVDPNVNVEVLLCDDGSTDGTVAILKSYADRLPDLAVLVHNDQREQFPAPSTPGRWLLLHAVKRAKGKLIAFLDGDDLWSDFSKIQRQWEMFAKNDDLLLSVHNGWDVRPDGTKVDHVRARYLKEELPEVYGPNDVILSCLFQKAAIMVRKDAVLKELDFYSSVPSFDWALLTLVAIEYPIRYIDRKMAIRHIGPNGIISGKDRYYKANWYLKVVEMLDSKTKGKYRATAYPAQVNTLYCCLDWAISDKDNDKIQYYSAWLDSIRGWRSTRDKIRTRMILNWPGLSEMYHKFRTGRSTKK